VQKMSDPVREMQLAEWWEDFLPGSAPVGGGVGGGKGAVGGAFLRNPVLTFQERVRPGFQFLGEGNNVLGGGAGKTRKR